MSERARGSSVEEGDKADGDRPAYQSPAAIIIFLLPAISGLVADLALKAWAFPGGVPAAGPAGRHPAELGGTDWAMIPHVLTFQTTVNHGAVFGIAQGMAAFFLVFSIFAMTLILWVFVTSRSRQWIVHLALGMITAGALGNLYDRAMFGGVRDMLRFYVNWYPFIFNIADVMLCIGVPLLVLRWLFVKDEAPGRG